MEVFVEKFGDIKILRYLVPEFEALDLKKKLYIYYLSEAALCGRDILWDQNNSYNLSIRSVLENIWKSFKGNRETDAFKSFETYFKRVLFSNGIHHHYSTEKLPAGFSEVYFEELIDKSKWWGFNLPPKTKFKALIASITEVIFNPEKETKRVNLHPDKDLLLSSSNNYYQDVTQQEAEAYYTNLKSSAGAEPVSFGLNSTLVKENGQLVEKVWKVDGKYGPAIEKIIFWLEKAIEFAENDQQKKTHRFINSIL